MPSKLLNKLTSGTLKAISDLMAWASIQSIVEQYLFNQGDYAFIQWAWVGA